MLSVEVFRQASSGPTPVKNSSNSPIGMFTLLKNGAPTLMRFPVNHSENTGKSVPERTATQETSRIRLLNKKLDSRETIESSWFSLFRESRFLKYAPKHTSRMIPMKPPNQFPILEFANACTELTTPLRVRNVPRIQSKNVQNTSHTFHTFIMPRFSCIITECRNAVPVSHGSSDAFSTGSQPQ